jgi:hypothetical protein
MSQEKDELDQFEEQLHLCLESRFGIGVDLVPKELIILYLAQDTDPEEAAESIGRKLRLTPISDGYDFWD